KRISSSLSPGHKVGHSGRSAIQNDHQKTHFTVATRIVPVTVTNAPIATRAVSRSISLRKMPAQTIVSNGLHAIKGSTLTTLPTWGAEKAKRTAPGIADGGRKDPPAALPTQLELPEASLHLDDGQQKEKGGADCDRSRQNRDLYRHQAGFAKGGRYAESQCPQNWVNDIALPPHASRRPD